MKKAVQCEITCEEYGAETLWMVSVAFEEVEKAIILLSALSEGRIGQAVFRDPAHGRSLTIRYSPQESTSKRKKTADSPILQLDTDAIAVTDTWFHAVWGLLLNVWLDGWNETAHLDAEFSQDTKPVSVFFVIAPPLFSGE